MYDVVVVGAGPAGLQAAVSAASDGLSVCVVAAGRIGGQIGETPRFENSVLATGQTGPELVETFMAAIARFQVDWIQGHAYSLSGWRNEFTIRWENPAVAGRMLPDDETGSVRGRHVVLALGKAWKPLPVPGITHGVAMGTASYGPRLALAKSWGPRDHVVLYGGGPASGQAAVVLGEKGVKVSLLCRHELSMPQYLIDTIDGLDSVTVHTGRTLLYVDPFGERIMLHADKGWKFLADHLMVCAGQHPATAWLKGSEVKLTDDGRVAIWKGQCGTSLSGVYAVGDCRAGSAHRVPSAMGDGSMAIHELWREGKAEDRPACHPTAPIPEDATCLIPV